MEKEDARKQTREGEKYCMNAAGKPYACTAKAWA